MTTERRGAPEHFAAIGWQLIDDLKPTDNPQPEENPMTHTTQTDVPQPTYTQPDGIRRWSWYDDQRDQFLIDAGTSPDRAVLVASEPHGTWLTADQCREAATVLLALADAAEVTA